MDQTAKEDDSAVSPQQPLLPPSQTAKEDDSAVSPQQPLLPPSQTAKEEDSAVSSQQPLLPPSEVITTPPQAGSGPSKYPPTLYTLATLSHFYVSRQPNLKDMKMDWVGRKKYDIVNFGGDVIYKGQELSRCCARNCCCSIRGFEMKIFDGLGQEIVSISRPLACHACCFPCCLQSIEVFSPPGTLIGAVEQELTYVYPRFSVKNEAGDVVLRLAGPFYATKCCADVDYKIVTLDGEKIGRVYKKYRVRTDGNVFGVEVPNDLDVKMKVVMLGAAMLIDAMYYNASPKVKETPVTDKT